MKEGGGFPYKEWPLCQAVLTGQGGRSPSRQQCSISNTLYGGVLRKPELPGQMKATKGKVSGQSERLGFSCILPYMATPATLLT